MPANPAPPQDDDLEGEPLPAFQGTSAPHDDDLDPDVTTLEPPLDDLSTPTREAPPTTPTPPRRPAAGATAPTPPPPSPPSPTSTDVLEGVDDALAGLAANGFHLLGIGVNRLAQRRRPGTELWIATADEAEAFGDALGRIAARRVPEELVGDSDTADLLIAGSAVVGYGMRNALGVTARQAAQAQAGLAAHPAAATSYAETVTYGGPTAPPPPHEPPPPATSVTRAAPPAPVDDAGAVPPVDDPTTAPAPPAVIDPGI